MSEPPSSPPLPAPSSARLKRLKNLRHLSYWLDDAIGIPGTRYRVGLDPIIGLIPGGGDTVGLLLSSAILLEAAGMGASKRTLGQMAFNILLEVVLGTVPMAGDFFDVVWKANNKNMQLLEQHLQLPQSGSRRRNRAFAIVLLIGLAAAVVGSAILSVLVFRWLLQTLAG